MVRCGVRLNAIPRFLAISLLAFPLSTRASFLTFLETQKNGVGAVTGLAGVFSVAVSPDGRNVYAAGTNDNSLVVFSRDAMTGKLAFTAAKTNGMDGVSGLAGAAAVAVSPDGKSVYVTGENDDAVVAFDRNPSDGTLSFVQMQKNGVNGVSGLDSADGVAVSPDGTNVYVAGFVSSTVAVFRRDTTSGALTFTQVKINGFEGVDGIDGASCVTVSPDGKHVYVTGQNENALVLFARDGTSGELSFVSVIKNGIGGVGGIAGATSVVVSPDGSSVYVTGFNDNAVAVFRRDENSGELSFVNLEKNGVGAVDGLGGALFAALSSDGTRLYAVGFNDDALAVFGRDGTTGALTFVESQTEGNGGVSGLAGASGVATSPDGASVYVAGAGDDAIAVFQAPPLPTSTPTTPSAVTLTPTPSPVGSSTGTVNPSPTGTETSRPGTMTARPTGTLTPQPAATTTATPSQPPAGTVTSTGTLPATSGGGGCAILPVQTGNGLSALLLLLPAALIAARRVMC
jgi:DNA-binding beta-propeller fold protein YncE